MLAQDGPVTEELFEEFAEKPSNRDSLWAALEKFNRLDRFPKRYRDQKILAEADIIDWLNYLTKLGDVPERIEFLQTVDVQSSEES